MSGSRLIQPYAWKGYCSMDEERKEYIKAWILKTEHDLKNASIIIDSAAEDKPYDTVCFHCQQAAEKYLKAYLIYLDILFPKTHFIARLIQLGLEKDPELEKIMRADSLTPYGAEIRYPDDYYEVSENDAKEALSISLCVKNYISGKLNLYT